MSSDGFTLGRRSLGLLGAGLAAAAAGLPAVPSLISPAKAAPAPETGPIKVGILHSLSGTMAISEAPLKDVMLMLISEQNKKGGVMGRPLEPVVVDPASNWPLFAEKARQLLSVDKVAAVFGCWTSVSRKSVLPVFEQLDRHPVLPGPVRGPGVQPQHLLHRRGAEPAGDPGGRLSDEPGGREALGAGRHRLRLSAHHQQDPGGLPEVEGREARRHHDQLHPVRLFRLAGERRQDQGVRLGREEDRASFPPSTAMPTCRSTRSSATRASRRPTSRWWHSASASRNSPGIEHRAAGRPARGLELFRERRHPGQQGDVAAFKAFTKNDKRVFNDPMEAHYIGFNMWVKAVEKAGTTEPDAVIDAMIGVSHPNLTGDYATMMPNHHLTKPVLIGEVQANGQFNVVWQTPGLVVAQPWSPYLPEFEEPDRRLAAADVLRQLRRGGRQMPRQAEGVSGRMRRWRQGGSSPGGSSPGARLPLALPACRAAAVPAAAAAAGIRGGGSVRRPGVHQYRHGGAGHPRACGLRQSARQAGDRGVAGRQPRRLALAATGCAAVHSYRNGFVDARTGAPVANPPMPVNLRPVILNDTVRAAIETAAGVLDLFSPREAKRRAAAEALYQAADPGALPTIERALAREKNAGIARVLREARAAAELKSATASVPDRLAAIKVLETREDLSARNLLASPARPKAGGGRRGDRGDRADRPAVADLGAGGGRLLRHFARRRAAARRRRACHHLRRDGRDQHGAWRDGDDRRLHDLRRAAGDRAPLRRP